MSNGVVFRKSVEGLTAADLADLRNGYRRMQAIGDNRGFNYIAGFHGVPGHFCHHPPQELFFPWHRAYLYHFEQHLRDLVPKASIPWWDWSSDASRLSGIPAAFSDLTDAAGQPNPLAKSHISVLSPPVSKDTARDPRAPNELPLPTDVQHLLSLGDFSDFSLQAERLHNRIHLWVRGDMGLVDFAAYDPIFFSHHSMIDRIWYLWQIKNGPAGLPNVLNTVLPPFPMTVADVLDTTKLGYEYALTQVSS